MRLTRRIDLQFLGGSAFAGFRFPPDVIVLAVRWYLRFGLSYRDVEELLAERGIDVDHVTVHRWVRRFAPLLSTRPDSADTGSGTAGTWTRPTSKSPAAGSTCTAPSTSSARSSTYTRPPVATARRPGSSSSKRRPPPV
jgi:hypothetical protein